MNLKITGLRVDTGESASPWQRKNNAYTSGQDDNGAQSEKVGADQANKQQRKRQRKALGGGGPTGEQGAPGGPTGSGGEVTA